MPVFGAYARYYNLLYKDKDYTGEADYIHRLIGQHQPQARTILDLGCGTGRHDQLLTRHGYELTGVDQSAEMLAVAATNAHPTLNFLQGDIRSIRLEKTFDVVISLFHVVSYQTSNEELAAVMATARAHLKPGGIFIFDCWYGPAVLTDRPSIRIKRLEDETTAITRIAEPLMYPNDNRVDVHYQVHARDKQSGETAELHETHRMRYLFRPELELLLSAQGMNIQEYAAWMTGKEAGFDSWSVYFVVKG